MDGTKKIAYGRLLVLALSVGALSLHAMPPPNGLRVPGDNRLALYPQPTTIDQVIHNKSNIVTTIDNWGYVGGYSHYDLPSGEWPRNSGHSYLAEIMYWMGAVTPAGDTLVANSSSHDTYDDFQAIPMPVNGADDYKIYLSTDSTRYNSYDLSDTTGLGFGNPAYGWRVWDGEGDAWEYNETYNSLASNFRPGGPTSLQDSHYRFNDAASGSSLMGLELTHTVLQWNYCYNEDFMYIILEITNTSDVDYDEFAFGLYVDIDVGGDDGVGGNGRQEDVVFYDTTENVAFIYDSVGVDPGWGPTVRTGVMGTKLLETPVDVGMTAVGMTALRTDDWAFLPDDDAGRFAMINSTQFDTPLPPTDQFYVQCARGINLAAGATVRIVYALIAGADSAQFMDNADMAQQLYDNYFVGPQPPPTPTLEARASDRKVYLNWNDTAEVGLDPLTAENDFAGYKLYRSDNHGKTWGVVNYNTGNDCLDVDYTPVALYTVNSPGDPIPHSFIDIGLYNGVEYWYCLAAFDKGDSTIDPLQTGFGIAGEVSNVLAATPVNNPAGFYDAAGTVTHTYAGSDQPSDGEIVPIVFDNDYLVNAEYQVVFEDSPEATHWHLVNVTTGDTVLSNQTLTNADPGLYDIAEGLRVVVNNGDRVARSYGQTALGGPDTNLVVKTFYGPALNVLFGVETMAFGDVHFRSTYELRHTGDSTRATWLLDGYYGTDFPYWVGFEVWNVSTSQRVSLAVYDFGLDDVWDPYDLLIIVNYPYDSITSVTPDAYPLYYSWMFGFDETVYNPSVGDVFTVEGAPLNGPDDIFAFNVDGINSAQAANQLKDIRVVPNPYFVQYSSMVETSEGQSVLEFQKLPDECTIRIYSLSGDLIETIVHNDGTGTAGWDLLSSHARQVSSGIYIYHIESSYGERLGRFAVIK